jgi:hypothetical protein
MIRIIGRPAGRPRYREGRKLPAALRRRYTALHRLQLRENVLEQAAIGTIINFVEPPVAEHCRARRVARSRIYERLEGPCVALIYLRIVLWVPRGNTGGQGAAAFGQHFLKFGRMLLRLRGKSECCYHRLGESEMAVAWVASVRY